MRDSRGAYARGTLEKWVLGTLYYKRGSVGRRAARFGTQIRPKSGIGGMNRSRLGSWSRTIPH